MNILRFLLTVLVFASISSTSGMVTNVAGDGEPVTAPILGVVKKQPFCTTKKKTFSAITTVAAILGFAAIMYFSANNSEVEKKDVPKPINPPLLNTCPQDLSELYPACNFDSKKYSSKDKLALEDSFNLLYFCRNGAHVGNKAEREALCTRPFYTVCINDLKGYKTKINNPKIVSFQWTTRINGKLFFWCSKEQLKEIIKKFENDCKKNEILYERLDLTKFYPYRNDTITYVIPSDYTPPSVYPDICLFKEGFPPSLVPTCLRYGSDPSAQKSNTTMWQQPTYAKEQDKQKKMGNNVSIKRTKKNQNSTKRIKNSNLLANRLKGKGNKK